MDWFLGFMYPKCTTENSWRDMAVIGSVGTHHLSSSILSITLRFFLRSVNDKEYHIKVLNSYLIHAPCLTSSLQ
uniref:Putative ovule protein n=1 Tax=Solanum chacoense TaxID=4108 RepID=A0A0V0GNC4_SOLCH